MITKHAQNEENMIVDKIQNWEDYPFGNTWELAFNFLKTLTIDSDEQKYNILNDDIFAVVTSYETTLREEAILETHRKYIDIQAIFTGRERIECYSRDELVVDVPYTEVKEAEFYKKDINSNILIDFYPGNFVMFFPKDAHMTSILINNKPEFIKKVVIKINVKLIS